MTRPKPLAWLLLITGAALLLTAVFLITVTPVQAQCGASATSCKTCHELNGEYPVNDKGVWHTDHTSGDYCAACHRGDTTATDADAAHTDMIDSLEAPERTCQICHRDNYTDLVAVYQEALENGGAAAEGSSAASVDPLDAPAAPVDPLDAPAQADQTQNVQQPASGGEALTAEEGGGSAAGNRILVVLAEALFIIGVGLVWYFERRG